MIKVNKQFCFSSLSSGGISITKNFFTDCISIDNMVFKGKIFCKNKSGEYSLFL